MINANNKKILLIRPDRELQGGEDEIREFILSIQFRQRV